MKSALAIGTIVLVTLFAGCAAPAVETVAPPSSAPTVVNKAGGTAQILGTIRDDEGRGIEGAEIEVAHRTTSNATRLASDAAGRFTLEGLEAGTYVVYARKLGFFDAQPKSVELDEGETAQVNVTLRPLPSIVPFHQTKNFRVMMTWNACVVVGAPVSVTQCGASVHNTGNITTRIEVDEMQTGELDTMVVEMKWTPTVGLCPASFRSDVFSPDQADLDATFPSINSRHWADSNPFHWDNVPDRVKSPTRLVIQRVGDPLAMHSAERTELNGGEPIETSGGWTIQPWYYATGPNGLPVDVYCVANQPVDIWSTVFFVDPMPTADWTAVA